MASERPGSFYEVLGVTPTATDAELKRAFVGMARRHHPDFHEGADPRVRAAHERAMQVVNDAWAVLGDPGRRQAYDTDRRLFGNRPPSASDRWEAGRTADADAAARKAWRPYDDSDADDVDVDSTDFATRHDRPITPALVPRILTMLPIVLIVGGFVLLAFGLLVSVGRVAAVGFAAMLASLPLFLAAPFYAMTKSQNDGSWTPRSKGSSSRRSGR